MSSSSRRSRRISEPEELSTEDLSKADDRSDATGGRRTSNKRRGTRSTPSKPKKGLKDSEDDILNIEDLASGESSSVASESEEFKLHEDADEEEIQIDDDAMIEDDLDVSPSKKGRGKTAAESDEDIDDEDIGSLTV
jgi:hypothetical protein